MSSASSAVQWDDLASDCERAAALLSAGLPSTVAWTTVFDEHMSSTRTNAQPGRTVTSVEYALVKAAWAASVEIGAPLRTTMTMLAHTYRALAGIGREVDSAVAGPRLATRVMLTLPAISVVLAGGLGMNILHFFFANVFGTACLLTGALLTGAGWWWSRQLVSRISTDAVRREITAIVIVAGLRAGVGVKTTTDALTRHLGTRASPDDAQQHLQKLETLSSTWGVPLADLLMSEVHQSRDTAVARLRKQCAELAERLLIPLGACVLPAFIALGVAPIVFELITTSGIAVTAGAS